MEYKGYIVTAIVKSYDRWTLDASGQLDDFHDGLDGVEVVSYEFDNAETGDSFSLDMSESDLDELKQSIDQHLAEITNE